MRASPSGLRVQAGRGSDAPRAGRLCCIPSKRAGTLANAGPAVPRRPCLAATRQASACHAGRTRTRPVPPCRVTSLRLRPVRCHAAPGRAESRRGAQPLELLAAVPAPALDQQEGALLPLHHQSGGLVVVFPDGGANRRGVRRRLGLLAERRPVEEMVIVLHGCFSSVMCRSAVGMGGAKVFTWCPSSAA